MAVVLVIGGSLLAQSLAKLYEQGPGFRSKDVKSLYVLLPTYEMEVRNNQDSQRNAGGWYRRVMEAAASAHGVRSVAAVSHLPLAGFYYLSDFQVEGFHASEDRPHAIDRYVSDSYHELLGIPLREGRRFNRFDRIGSQPVAIANDAFVKRYFPDRSAVGGRVRYAGGGDWFTIVGVVPGERAGGMEEELRPMLYLSMDQNPWSAYHLVVKATSICRPPCPPSPARSRRLARRSRPTRFAPGTTWCSTPRGESVTR